MKLDPLAAFGIMKTMPRRAAPAPKPIPSRPLTPRARAERTVASKLMPPTQEDIDRARGYVSALGGVAK
jgi:hypothetical protein